MAECVVPLLFAALLDRPPEPAADVYWAQVYEAEGGEALAGHLLDQAETTATGREVWQWYDTVLGRRPDPAGLAWWSSLPAGDALWGIVSSVEAGCVDPAPVVSSPPGWVDAGHGVFVPPVLLVIRECESGGDYSAANPRSSARGAYQFLRSSWVAYGHADRYGVPSADLATPAQQDEAAVITWQRDGTRPWLCAP